MKHFRAALAVVVALLTGAPALAAGQPQVIRIAAVGLGQGKSYGTGTVTLAQEQGFFAQEFAKDGVKVEITYFTGTGPAINEALATGQADFGEYGALPNLIGLAGGVPAKIVVAHSAVTTSYILVHTGPRGDAIKDVKDLKGRKITVAMGSNPHQDLVNLLKGKGLAENDVRLVNLKIPDAIAAFNAGAVDAVYGGLNLLALRDQGLARVLADSRGVPAAQSSAGGILVTNSFEKAHPDLTERVVKVLIRANLWASQDSSRDALLKIYARSGSPIKYLAEEYAPPLKPRQDPRITKAVVAGYHDSADFALAHHLIREKVDPAVWFEPKYLTAALKELNLEHYWDDNSAALAAR